MRTYNIKQGPKFIAKRWIVSSQYLRYSTRLNQQVFFSEKKLFKTNQMLNKWTMWKFAIFCLNSWVELLQSL